MTITPEALAERILYQDSDVLVLDKPIGLAVHQAPGVGASLDLLLPSLAGGLKTTPALAHRLDRDTSGCLVLGRHPRALKQLMALFAQGAVEKTYWAVVEGAPPTDSGVATQSILKVHRGGAWMMVADRRGQKAETAWRVLGQGDGTSWLALAPRTGRTHQIRVHCTELGCPILGDRAYGARPGVGQQLHLHAHRIRFRLTEKARWIDVAAPPPRHMVPALAACGYRPDPPTE